MRRRQQGATSLFSARQGRERAQRHLELARAFPVFALDALIFSDCVSHSSLQTRMTTASGIPPKKRRLVALSCALEGGGEPTE